MQHNATRTRGLAVALTVTLCLGQTCAPPPPAESALAPETARVAFKSQCALNVITCTSSWPVAQARVEALQDQTLTPTESGFIVQGYDGNGSERVQFVGDESTAGEGATALFYTWSSGATDDDPRTLEPGIEFSSEANPVQRLQTGFHYIRLTVRNDIVRDIVVSEEFGVIAENVQSFDFIELQVEVRD